MVDVNIFFDGESDSINYTDYDSCDRIEDQSIYNKRYYQLKGKDKIIDIELGMNATIVICRYDE